jgi:hypothetical protein
MSELSDKWYKAGYDDGIAFERKQRADWAKDMLVELINKFPPDSSVKFRDGINWFCNEILKRMEKTNES